MRGDNNTFVNHILSQCQKAGHTLAYMQTQLRGDCAGYWLMVVLQVRLG